MSLACRRLHVGCHVFAMCAHVLAYVCMCWAEHVAMSLPEHGVKRHCCRTRPPPGIMGALLGRLDADIRSIHETSCSLS